MLYPQHLIYNILFDRYYKLFFSYFSSLFKKPGHIGFPQVAIQDLQAGGLYLQLGNSSFFFKNSA